MQLRTPPSMATCDQNDSRRDIRVDALEMLGSGATAEGVSVEWMLDQSRWGEVRAS